MSFEKSEIFLIQGLRDIDFITSVENYANSKSK